MLFLTAPAATQGDPVALLMVLALAVVVTVMALRKLRLRKRAARAVPVTATPAPAPDGGVLFPKFLNLFSKKKVNPMIGAAGISAFPMSGRIVHKMAL